MLGVEAGVGLAEVDVFGAQDDVDVVGDFELGDELVQASAAFVAYEDGDDVAGAEFGEGWDRSVEEVREWGGFGGVEGSVELHHFGGQGLFAAASGEPVHGCFEREAYGGSDLLDGWLGEIIVREGFAHAGPDALQRGGDGAVEVEDYGFDGHSISASKVLRFAEHATLRLRFFVHASVGVRR